MKSERELQQDVGPELAFDPAIDAAGIGAAVHDGIVKGDMAPDIHRNAAFHAAGRERWCAADVRASGQCR